MHNAVDKIHANAMAILAKIGIKIHLPDICSLLKSHGIRIDGNLAYFSEEQVMAWVGKAPSEFTLHARNPAYNARIGGDRPQYVAGYGCAEIIDADGVRRMASLADYIRFVQLVHHNDHFNINGGILAQPVHYPSASPRFWQQSLSVRCCGRARR